MLAEFERKILREAIEIVREARRAPPILGAPLEPTWTVLLASNEVVHVRETQMPGDEIDAVTRAWGKVKGRIEPEEVALFLTLEPSAFYQRIGPVTEAIRHSGIKRIIVGAEDPYLRSKGKGIENLRRQGCTVVLADGEEARACQLFYADYAKAVNRFIPLWTIAWDLQAEGAEKVYQASAVSEITKIPGIFDITCVEYKSHSEKPPLVSPDSILLFLDSYGGLKAASPMLTPERERVLVALGEAAEVNPAAEEKFEKVLRVPLDGERIDLGALARKLRDLNIFSIITLEGVDIWSALIRAGIVDRVLVRVHSPYNVNISLVMLTGAKIHLSGDKLGQDFCLKNPRLLSQDVGSYWVEAEVQLLRSSEHSS